MTGIQLTLPASNWTSLVLNGSLGNGDGSIIGYGNVHDLHPNNGNNDLDRGVGGGGGGESSPPRSRSEEEWGSCRDWQDAQHTLFQLANVCAAVSILTKVSFRHHLLFLRCLLLVAFLFFVLWAGLFVCMIDVLVWNCVFFLVDLIHIVYLAYNSIPVRISSDLCELYAKRFKPLRVTRKEFSDLCSLGNMVPIRKGTHYATKGVTPCGEKVSMLIRGRLKVSHGNTYLHCIQPNEFVDSVEFDSIPFHEETTEKFQVTVAATEDSVLMSWRYPILQDNVAGRRPFVWAVFKGMVGKDVSDKLYRIQELLIKDPDTMLGSAPSTPRPPAFLHNSRKHTRNTRTTSSVTLTPRHGVLRPPVSVPKRRSSLPDFPHHMTQVPPPQTTLNLDRIESFV